ncbi:MAG: FGGY-family carbohydrate kinase [Promethearchaeota archaeon]
MTELICVFDCGTTGTRTILFDLDGKEISRAYEEYQLPPQPVGISEHDPEIWWNAIKNTCISALKKVNPEDVIGICADFHRATCSIIDANGEILHPALTWMDEREVTDMKSFQEEGGLRRSIPKILWFKKNKPDLFNKTQKIIFPDTFTYMKLCGKDTCVTDPTNGIYGIINKETLTWDEKLAEEYGIPVELWPELHFPGEIIGELTSEAASETGLKKGIPVVLGGGDQQCSALGLGVINKGEAKVTTGTGTFVDLVVEGPVKQVGDVPIFSLPHVIKGKWVIEGTMPGTGTMFQTYARNFSQLQIEQCKDKDTSVYEILTEEAKQAPPGSNGLLFIPLYVFRKGTIHGLGWHHTRAHFSRAIMESAALSAQMYLQMLEAMGGAKVEVIKSDGGAMNSSFWAQIFADILGKKIMVPENKDGAALGAAILGLWGLKKYSSIENAIEKMVRFESEFVPDKANVKIYKKLIRVFMPEVLRINEAKRITKDL